MDNGLKNSLWDKPRVVSHSGVCMMFADVLKLVPVRGQASFNLWQSWWAHSSNGNLEIWWMTLENNKTPLLYYVKLCMSFQSHGWIQTRVTIRKCSIQVKISDFFSCVTLKFDRWLWKIIGHLFYATMILWIISKPLVNSNWSYSPETLNSGKNWQFFVPCDLEILWITLENIRAPLLYYVKLFDYFKAIGEFKLELQSGYTQFG